MKKCCVLIPYYDSGTSLLDSILSIDVNFITPDVVVVDDGSSQISARNIIPGYTGPINIKLIELPINQGIEHALNAGLLFCKGRYQYIARLDCGDLCKNKRIEQQVKYLDGDLECFLIGAWADYVNKSGDILFTLQQPVAHIDILKKMYLNSAFIHPAVMFRSTILDEVGLYPLAYPAAEDYAFFYKVVRKLKSGNLPEILLDYEVDPGSISSIKRKKQIESRIKVIIHNFDFSLLAFYGLARSVLLWLAPRNTIVALKAFAYKHSRINRDLP